MKQLLIIFAILPALAQAALPAEGKYNCFSSRSFTNTTVSTKDNITLQFWLSKAGNPVIKVVTQDPAVSAQPSIFGGTNSELLQPLKLETCVSGNPVTQAQSCAQAILPALNDNQNLFTTPGVQYVHSVKISGNFSRYSVVPKLNDSLAAVINYRKNNSHWERLYLCTLVK